MKTKAVLALTAAALLAPAVFAQTPSMLPPPNTAVMAGPPSSPVIVAPLRESQPQRPLPAGAIAETNSTTVNGVTVTNYYFNVERDIANDRNFQRWLRLQ